MSDDHPPPTAYPSTGGDFNASGLLCSHSPPPEGWTAKPDGVVYRFALPRSRTGWPCCSSLLRMLAGHGGAATCAFWR